MTRLNTKRQLVTGEFTANVDPQAIVAGREIGWRFDGDLGAVVG